MCGPRNDVTLSKMKSMGSLMMQVYLDLKEDLDPLRGSTRSIFGSISNRNGGGLAALH